MDEVVDRVRDCPSCGRSVSMLRVTCPMCGEKIYRTLAEREKGGTPPVVNSDQGGKAKKGEGIRETKT